MAGIHPIRVLLIGCGGREHAIACAITKSSLKHELHCIGPYRNPELLRLSKSYAQHNLDDITQIIRFANKVKPDLCIIGPEKPLEAGIVDALNEAGFHRCIGPPKKIAQLETDKAWCRDFLMKYNLQQYSPRYKVFSGFETRRNHTNSTSTSTTSNHYDKKWHIDSRKFLDGINNNNWTKVDKDRRLASVKQWDEVEHSVKQFIMQELMVIENIHEHPLTNNIRAFNFVIKPLGLQGGKGVKVSGDHFSTLQEGIEYCHELYLAGSPFLIEEQLYGKEFSQMTITDGKHCIHLPVAIDFKRAFDHDKGPNTGGMGCITFGVMEEEKKELQQHNKSDIYRRVPVKDKVQEARKLTERIVQLLRYTFPSIKWAGVLFGGFMHTHDNKLKLLEYNMRFGDPEAISVLASICGASESVLEKIDLLELFLKVSTSSTDIELTKHITIEPPSETVCVLYICPQAYPAKPQKNICLQFEKLFAKLMEPVSGSSICIIAAGITVEADQLPQGNIIASDIWENVAGQPPVAVTPDAKEILESGKMKTTGSRAFALVAIGHDAMVKVATIVLPRLQELTNNVFRWRSDIIPIAMSSPQKRHQKCKQEEKEEQEEKVLLVQEEDDENYDTKRLLVHDDGWDGRDEYTKAGVNIKLANEAVTSIQELIRSTHTGTNVLHIPGGFGGLFRIPSNSDSLLVSSTDSVGSKPHLVLELYDDDTALYMLGQDLVNHNVNDILTMGCTRPLYFLDYFAANVLDAKQLYHFIRGVSNACKKVGCAIIGGETAEIRQTYKPNALDLVGCITGIVSESELFRPHTTLKSGDIAIAIPSVSAHTNGFTLINKIYHNMSNEERNEHIEWFKRLVRPHRCYLKDIKTLQAKKIDIKALIHVTGGGLIDNPPRVLPPDGNLYFQFDRDIILQHMPAMFWQLAKQCDISLHDDNDLQFYRTFNCGIGLIVIVDKKDKNIVQNILPNTFAFGSIMQSSCGNYTKKDNHHYVKFT